MRSEGSAALYSEAKRYLPGGVSSPVRAYGPYPLYIKAGKGPMIYDVDGNEYIDYCMGFGPLILGHARKEVVDALRAQLDLGTLYGAPVEKELHMARLLHRHYPSMEMMRFVSSGTEATMHAIRLARGHTGRKKLIKVEGAFHGAHDPVLVRAGSGATTHCAPDSLGIPDEVTRNTLLVPYNDIRAVRRTLLENKGEVAAMILEPVIGNAGPILPKDGYLQELRELTSQHDVLLIFDEVITGFRLAMGGAQQYFNVRPDITVLGKIAGGGLPFGAFGASSEIMSSVSPLGKVYQAGTFSGNPLSLTAGIETISVLEKEGHDGLSHQGERMRNGLRSILDELHLGFQVVGIGSMFQIFFTEQEVNDYADAKRCDPSLFKKMFDHLLEKGIYLPPSQYETNFLSTAHTAEVIDRTLDGFAEALSEVFR
ncbi:MAG: glutamate-1-semialdehyde 2,1-aminomutase [Methanomassiliicoccales archaeon]|nr:MAG: glutamate-1-semialdehyde 2,1-aminomutase [Methanomassiliicoccales archaeon]